MQWRRTRIFASVLLMMLGIVTMRWPTLRDHHWPSHVPTWLLIDLWGNVEWQWSTRELGRRFNARLDAGPYVQSWAIRFVPTEAQHADFAEKANAVLIAPETSSWQRAHLLGWLSVQDRLSESVVAEMPGFIASTDPNLSVAALVAMRKPQFQPLLADGEIILKLIAARERLQTQWSDWMIDHLLASSPHPSAAQFLDDAMNSADAALRRSALAVVPLNDRNIDQLIAALDDEDRSCRFTAAGRLGMVTADPERIVPILGRHLREGDRVLGAGMLSAHYAPFAHEYIADFIKLLEAPEVDVRGEAARSIGRMADAPGADQALPLLVEMLSGERTDVMYAIEALSRFDREALLPYSAQIQMALESNEELRRRMPEPVATLRALLDDHMGDSDR